VTLSAVPRVAWLAALLSIALGLAAMGLAIAVPAQPGLLEQVTDVVVRGWSLCFAAVGLLILSKRSVNRMGWVTLGLAFTASATAMLDDLSRVLGGRVSQLGLDFGLLSDIAWLVMITLLGWFLLLFPTGDLPSRRWRPLAWALAAWPPAFTAAALLAPVGMQGGAPAPNPFVHIEGPLGDFLNLAVTILMFLFLPLLGGVAAASITRFLRSRGVERQQLKWVAYSAGLLVFAMFATAVWSAQEVRLLANLAFLALPIAVAIAILRYRLYDIDLLIKRTFVYGATSAAIAATFYLGIVALQGLIRPITLGSELPVAASTLVSFALFQPIRRRVQRAIDQRFDRSRYDAAKTVDAFADLLRDEVDLDALRAELLGAVIARCHRRTRASG
jgi:hypothetical protein